MAAVADIIYIPCNCLQPAAPVTSQCALKQPVVQLYPSCKFLTDQCNEHPWVPFLCAAADTWCTATEWQPPLTFAGRSVNIYGARPGTQQGQLLPERAGAIQHLHSLS